MSDSLMYLEQAMELGRTELDHLMAGHVEEAEKSAYDRGRLIAKALAERGDIAAEALFEKLTLLKSQQGQLTEEAKRLHSALREDVLRTRQENVRHTGYNNSTKITPIFSRFVDKEG